MFKMAKTCLRASVSACLAAHSSLSFTRTFKTINIVSRFLLYLQNINRLKKTKTNAQILSLPLERRGLPAVCSAPG